MILTFERISSVTSGAVSLEQAEDGIHFYKCTKRQIEAWYKRGNSLGVRAETTTGVCLDFHTDATELCFSVAGGDGFEVMVNGLLRTRLKAGGPASFRVSLEDVIERGAHGTREEGTHGAERRVTVCFPCHSKGILVSAELVGATFVRPHEYDRSILMIGDSITQGWASQYDCLSYAARVRKFFNASCTVQGVGGGTFAPDTFDRIPTEPDIVTVAYGTNDFDLVPDMDTHRENVRTYLGLVKEAYGDRPVFVITPLWRGRLEGRKMGSFGDCCEVIRREAEALSLIVVDGFSLVPPIEAFYTDGWLHPNDDGFSVYAENLIMEMERVLRRA